MCLHNGLSARVPEGLRDFPSLREASMKWYQHEANCHNDECMREVIHENGLQGYAIYHICLELISGKIDDNLIPEITISERVLREKLRLKSSRISKLLSSISLQTLLEISKVDGGWKIGCRNLLKRLDNWTKRSVVATEQVPLEYNKKRIQHSKEPLNNGYFNTLWASYPKRVGRGAAENSFKKINPGEDLFKKIVSAVELAKKSEQWKKENGQFIPHLSTFLNQKRWEDDYSSGIQEKDHTKRLSGVV